MKLRIFSAICLLVFLLSPTGRRSISGSIRSAVLHQASNRIEMSSRDENENERTGGDDRARWFISQRMYPFDSLPADARRMAWNSIRPKTSDGATRFNAIDATQPSWISLGPRPTISLYPGWGVLSGHINTIAIKPDDPNTVLIGGETGGIWRSADGGAHFLPVSDDQVDLAVGSIAFSPSNPSIVYAGMGSSYLGSGILKSTDAGQSWSRVNNATFPVPGAVQKLVVDPRDPNRINVALRFYITTQDGRDFGGGFYLSTDGGVNWTRTRSGVARDIAINPANPLTLYGAITSFSNSSTPTAGIYRSADGGRTWGSAPIYAAPYGTSTRDVKVAISPADPQTVWVYAGDRSSPAPNVRIAAIDDTGKGISWTPDPNTFDSAQSLSGHGFLAADPADARTVYIGARDAWKITRNAADTLSLTNLSHNYAFQNGAWTSNFNFGLMHNDQDSIAFSPGNPNAVFFGNDGGLWKSSDAGKTFLSLNDTLSLTQFYSVTGHPTDRSLLFGGTQDNGLLLLTGSPSWKMINDDSDFGNVVINPSNSNLVFSAEAYYPGDLGGLVGRYDINTQTFREIADYSTFGEPVTGGRIAFIPPLVGNGTDSTLYYGTSRLFISRDLGRTWTAPGGTTDLTKGGSDVLKVIAVSSANPQVIYTGSVQGRVMISQDAGRTSIDITGSLPNRSITSITVDKSNPAAAYLTVSGYGSGHIFKTVDSGANWTDISGNLPNIPTNALLADPANPTLLYVGTDIGVFRSVSRGASWDSFNNGLPPVIVTSFSAQTGGLIRIGTFGRGAYEIQGPAVFAGFNINNRGGNSSTTDGAAVSVTPGYARIQPASGSTTPSGIAIFGFRNNDILVSETGVPATPLVTSGRIYAEVAGALDTGLAIANPNSSAATINFYFTDATGNPAGSASTMIPANQQIAKFLDQSPFKVYAAATFQGTFSFTSSVPVGVVALRGFTNERGDFLMSTLPVIDTTAAPNNGTVVLPHFADGGGWITQIFLVNPTDNPITGNVQFIDPNSGAANVTIGGRTNNTFAYSVSRRSSQKLVTAGATPATASGSVRIIPAGGGTAPTPLVVFSYKPAGITVSEAGVPVTAGSAFRMYVESAGTSGQSGNIQTGIAVANPSSSSAAVTFDVTDLNGAPITGITPVSITLPPSGQTAKFLADIFPSLPNPFKGVLRITTTSSGISVVGLRARYNERAPTPDFLITTTPPVLESSPANTTELLFPHLADGGGYTTQFILFSGTAGQSSSGILRFFDQGGQPLNLTLR